MDDEIETGLVDDESIANAFGQLSDEELAAEPGNADGDQPSHNEEEAEDGAEGADEQSEADEKGSEDSAKTSKETPKGDAEEDVFELTIGDEKVELKASEIIELRQRRDEYAKTRDEVETEVVSHAADQLTGAMKALQEQAARLVEQLEIAEQYAQPGKKPPFELAVRDPTRYAQAAAAWEARNERLTQIKAEKEQAQKAAQELQAKEESVKRTASMQALRKAWPEWNDTPEGQKLKEDTLRFMVETYKYTPDELMANLDHRDILVAKDAKAWRDLQKGQTKAAVTKKTAAAVQKLAPKQARDSQTGQFTKQDKARERLRKSGDIRANHGVFAAFLDD